MDSQFLNRCQDFYKNITEIDRTKNTRNLEKYTLGLERMEDMGRGTVREVRGNPVTEVTFKPQGRSPGLKLPYPIDQSTCPHNK